MRYGFGSLCIAACRICILCPSPVEAFAKKKIHSYLFLVLGGTYGVLDLSPFGAPFTSHSRCCNIPSQLTHKAECNAVNAFWKHNSLPTYKSPSCKMATLVVRPICLRLLSSSSCSPIYGGHSSPGRWISVSSTTAWISHQFSRTSIHSASVAEDVGIRYGIAFPCCTFGVKSPSLSCRQVASSSKGSQNEVALAEHRERLSTKQEWEGLQKWRRGGGSVHKLAKVDASVVVEVGAIIHAHAIVGEHTQISSGSVVGSHVVIGSHIKLGFNVALQNCSVGDFCMLHSGVCVGQDGFGFTVNDKGEMVKKPQMLRVQIGNNVEIGANTCIDRGSWRDTIIGDHTKIDNLVQIGHNVVIGRCCILCGQVGIAGSATLGDYVVMGGKSGVAEHVSVASKVRIAAKSAVTSSIREPGDYAGFPAIPAKEWRQSLVNFRRLGKQRKLGTDTHLG